MVRVVDQLVPVGAVDADGKSIGIEAGPRHHGQDLAIARIHRHNRAVAVAKRQLRGLLQIVVDRQLQVLPRNRVLDSQVANLPSVAVHNHFPRSVLPAQQRVVGLLHACLAHHIARLIVGKAWVVQVFFAHFAHVTNQVGSKAVAGIKSPLLVNGFQFRQFVAREPR